MSRVSEIVKLAFIVKEAIERTPEGVLSALRAINPNNPLWQQDATDIQDAPWRAFNAVTRGAENFAETDRLIDEDIRNWQRAYAEGRASYDDLSKIIARANAEANKVPEAYRSLPNIGNAIASFRRRLPVGTIDSPPGRHLWETLGWPMLDTQDSLKRQKLEQQYNNYLDNNLDSTDIQDYNE